MIAGTSIGIAPDVRSGDLILIVCEGSKTEPLYFAFLKNKLSIRHQIMVDTDCGTDPLSVVDRALELRSAKADLAAKGRGLEFDQVWCVFDHEAIGCNPRLSAGVNKAIDNGIAVAISNPCVEFWFLLHYRLAGGHHDCSAAMKVLKKQNKAYKKGGFDYATLLDKTGIAIKAAQLLRIDQQRTSCGKWPNPCTDLDMLLVEVVKNGSPELRGALGISNL